MLAATLKSISSAAVRAKCEASLSKKLSLDGIDFDGFVLKDNLRNLLRFRFRALKEQIGYKLPALLKTREKAHIESRETLFGDDAERDAFVYSLYADLVAERVSPAALDAVMQIAGVYADGRDDIYDALDKLEPADPVERIIIHLDRRSPPVRFEAYGQRVVPVYNYFQAALVLYADGRVRAQTVMRIGEALIMSHQFTRDVLIRSFQDVLRRGALPKAAAESLLSQAQTTTRNPDVVDAFARAFDTTRVRRIDTEPNFVPDYPMLLRRELDRHRIEKARRRGR